MSTDMTLISNNIRSGGSIPSCLGNVGKKGINKFCYSIS